MNTKNELEQKLTFTPIAMKCNQEQFDEIEPLLERVGCDIRNIGDFSIYDYLTNFGGDTQNIITNLKRHIISDSIEKYYNEWNKKTFLNACGIEWKEHPKVLSEDGNELFFDEQGNMIKKVESEEHNPLNDLPIIGDGVLMEVSDDEEDWYKAEVYCKIKDTFIA